MRKLQLCINNKSYEILDIIFDLFWGLQHHRFKNSVLEDKPFNKVQTKYCIEYTVHFILKIFFRLS